MKPERKFWHEVKKSTPQIKWTRIENSVSFGTPDLLGYNINSKFFTVELKVTKGNTVRFSPHQFSFHLSHPYNTFIMIKALGASHKGVKLYEGKNIKELASGGLRLEPLRQGLPACCSYLTWLEA